MSPRTEVLSLVNQKGGCGKTTTAIHLAGAFAARGERTLLVDLDPQAHATMGLGCAPVREPTIADVLIRNAPVASAVQAVAGGIDLLPASAQLGQFEEMSERTIQPERLLARALEATEVRYDWVVLDCPPRADGVLCANALYAATVAVLVVETGAFALQGAIKALRILEEVARNQDHRFDLRLVGTMFDRRTRFARELLVALHSRFGSALYDTVIRSSVRLREAAALGKPVQVLDPGSRAASDFTALAAEIAADLRRPAQQGPGSRTDAATVARLVSSLQQGDD